MIDVMDYWRWEGGGFGMTKNGMGSKNLALWVELWWLRVGLILWECLEWLVGNEIV